MPLKGFMIKQVDQIVESRFYASFLKLCPALLKGKDLIMIKDSYTKSTKYDGRIVITGFSHPLVTLTKCEEI